MNARINLNCYVAVILTAYGANIYNSYMRQFDNKFHQYTPTNTGQQIRLPLWELMHIFGGCLTMGFHSIPFEGNEIEFLR